MLGELLGSLGHLGGALELVPVEGLAVDGALHGLEQDPGEELAIGEALDPDVEEQPGVAFAGGVFALEREGECGGGEVDDEEREEEDEQLDEVGGAGGLGVEVLVDEVVDDAGDEHEVDERRDERKQDLEDEDVGQREEAHGAAVANGGFVLVEGLQDAEGPAEALTREAVGVDGGFGEGEGLVLVDDGVALLEKRHGEVGVFGDGVGVVAANGLYGGGAPCADGSGDDGDDVEEIESAALEVLRGDVLEGLPAGPEVHAVADLGVAGDGADARVGEVRTRRPMASCAMTPSASMPM